MPRREGCSGWWYPLAERGVASSRGQQRVLPVELHVATWGGHLEVTRWLSGHGGSVTQSGNTGRTPLYGAACNDHLAVVQWLAGNGGSVTEPTNGGRTPLYGAAHEGHLAVVQWLADIGGSVAQPTNGEATSLCGAVRKGQLAVVRWLAGSGGSVTQPPATGTPLSTLPRPMATSALQHFSPLPRHGQPTRSWWRAASPTMPSSRSGEAGSTPVPAPPPSPTSSPSARARRTRSGRVRPTSLRSRVGRSVHDVMAHLGTVSSTPGSALKSGVREPAQRPDSAVALDLQLLPPNGLGVANPGTRLCSARTSKSSIPAVLPFDERGLFRPAPDHPFRTRSHQQ